MKTKTGRLRVIETFGGCDGARLVWVPFCMCYKYEMPYQLRRMSNAFGGHVVKFRWRISGSEKWHIDFA